MKNCAKNTEICKNVQTSAKNVQKSTKMCKHIKNMVTVFDFKNCPYFYSKISLFWPSNYAKCYPRMPLTRHCPPPTRLPPCPGGRGAGGAGGELNWPDNRTSTLDPTAKTRN